MTNQENAPQTNKLSAPGQGSAPTQTLESLSLNSLNTDQLGQSPTGGSVSAALLRALRTFQRQRDAMRAGTEPYEVQHWSALLGMIDDYLNLPIEDNRLSDLLRVHLVVDAERDLDRIRQRLLPQLDEAIQQRLGQMDERLHQIRATHTKEFALQEQVVIPQDGQPYLYLTWPVLSRQLNSFFGPRFDPFTHERTFHTGLDIGANHGSLVRAAADGFVCWAGWSPGWGLVVRVQHKGDYETTYAHLAGTIVGVGVYVRQGQTIGMVGATGRATGPHLHFGVKHHGRYLDPLDVLGIPIPLDEDTTHQSDTLSAVLRATNKVLK